MPRSEVLGAALAFLFLGGSLLAWVWVGIRLVLGRPVLPDAKPRLAPWGLNGVLAVHWPDGRREPTIEHHAQAFEAVGRFQLFS